MDLKLGASQNFLKVLLKHSLVNYTLRSSWFNSSGIQSENLLFLISEVIFILMLVIRGQIFDNHWYIEIVKAYITANLGWKLKIVQWNWDKSSPFLCLWNTVFCFECHYKENNQSCPAGKKAVAFLGIFKIGPIVTVMVG